MPAGRGGVPTNLRGPRAQGVEACATPARSPALEAHPGGPASPDPLPTAAPANSRARPPGASLSLRSPRIEIHVLAWHPPADAHALGPRGALGDGTHSGEGHGQAVLPVRERELARDVVHPPDRRARIHLDAHPVLGAARNGCLELG